MTFPYLKSLVSSVECLKHSKEKMRMPISSKRYGEAAEGNLGYI